MTLDKEKEVLEMKLRLAETSEQSSHVELDTTLSREAMPRSGSTSLGNYWHPLMRSGTIWTPICIDLRG